MKPVRTDARARWMLTFILAWYLKAMSAPTRFRAAFPPRRELGLRRVLVGTDLSPDGDRALRRAAALSFAPRAKLLVIHVLPPRIAPAVASIVRGAAEVKLEAAVRRLRDRLTARGRTDISIELRVAQGRAAEVLDRLGRAYRTALVVVGRRGQSRIRELVLGSTARRLLRTGRHPVLVVGRQPEGPYRKALVGLDFSPEALRAARMTRQMVPSSASLVAVHAYEDPARGLPPGLIPDQTARVGAALRSRTRLVQRAIETAGRGDTPWRIEVTEGDARRVLLEAARAKKADLIAVGSAGKSRVVRTALGSVAEGVLDGAPCDVLVVRRPPRPAP